MSQGTDPALVWIDATLASPATHVLIIGVGQYAYGKGTNASLIGGDLRQLTSPPISARAMADWFIAKFQNPDKPLGSVSLLISEPRRTPYAPPTPGAPSVTPPRATLANVKAAAAEWTQRLSSHHDNMAVFYFCGHGISLGHKAALLLEDFGDPKTYFENAVDLESFLGTMKNSPAIQQMYLLDCCRTSADDLYKNETQIGNRIVSLSSLDRDPAIPPTQACVLFPTLDGAEAFGITKEVSAFTRSVIDAVSFAAADPSSGEWKTSTARILDSVNTQLRIRVPQLTKRSTPQGLDVTPFDFNVINEPQCSHSFVTVSDLKYWGQVELECSLLTGTAPPQKKHSKEVTTETCCTFTLDEGRWRFTGSAAASSPTFKTKEQSVRPPVAYVTIEVTP